MRRRRRVHRRRLRLRRVAPRREAARIRDASAIHRRSLHDPSGVESLLALGISRVVAAKRRHPAARGRALRRAPAGHSAACVHARVLRQATDRRVAVVCHPSTLGDAATVDAPGRLVALVDGATVSVPHASHAGPAAVPEVRVLHLRELPVYLIAGCLAHLHKRIVGRALRVLRALLRVRLLQKLLHSGVARDDVFLLLVVRKRGRGIRIRDGCELRVSASRDRLGRGAATARAALIETALRRLQTEAQEGADPGDHAEDRVRRAVDSRAWIAGGRCRGRAAHHGRIAKRFASARVDCGRRVVVLLHLIEEACQHRVTALDASFQVLVTDRESVDRLAIRRSERAVLIQARIGRIGRGVPRAV